MQEKTERVGTETQTLQEFLGHDPRRKRNSSARDSRATEEATRGMEPGIQATITRYIPRYTPPPRKLYNRNELDDLADELFAELDN